MYNVLISDLYRCWRLTDEFTYWIISFSSCGITLRACSQWCVQITIPNFITSRSCQSSGEPASSFMLQPHLNNIFNYKIQMKSQILKTPLYVNLAHNSNYTLLGWGGWGVTISLKFFVMVLWVVWSEFYEKWWRSRGRVAMKRRITAPSLLKPRPVRGYGKYLHQCHCITSYHVSPGIFPLPAAAPHATSFMSCAPTCDL